MGDLLFTDNTVTPSKRVPVKWAFTSPYRLPDSQFDVQLLYVNKTVEKFRDWFAKERASYLAQQAPMQETKKLEEQRAKDSELADENKLNEEESQKRKKAKEAKALWE